MYKFPLGAVLKHRKFLEDNLQKELGVLKRLLVDDKKKLSDIKNAKRKYSKELQFKQQKSITVSDNLLYIRFIDRLSKRLDMQNDRVFQSEQNVDEKRKELLEALKNKKVLERLKEKGIETYKQNGLKKERIFLNEMASVRFRRKT
jgi:flagellar FliJ protein